MRPLNRVQPQLPAAAMTTYQILAPLQTHWREATCSEVGCRHHEFGWMTAVDPTTELGQRQAYYIRNKAGRQFVERRAEGGFVEFIFDPGQQCFRPHQKTLERDPFYVRRGGDWRGNPRGIEPFRHTTAASFVDDFGSHLQTIADAKQKG